MSSKLKTTDVLIKVDKEMAIAVAASLLGAQVTVSESESATASFSWLLGASVSNTDTSGRVSDIRTLLPEHLAYEISKEVREIHETVGNLISVLPTKKPGDTILVRGQLDTHNKLVRGTEVSMLQDEECGVFSLNDASFSLPLYFPLPWKADLNHLMGQPVLISAVVRWTPPYSPKGSASLNLALRPFAIWLC